MGREEIRSPLKTPAGEATIVSVFDGLVCGFRFWPNFFAVLRFWMIFFFGFAVSNIPQCPPRVEISLENLNTGGYWGF